MLSTIENVKSFNQTYNLSGPKVYTLKEILELIIEIKKIRTKVIPLPDYASKFKQLLWNFTRKPFSIDNYNSCKIDSTCDSDFNFYSDLETIIPTYIS